jgi:hypothetical protein
MATTSETLQTLINTTRLIKAALTNKDVITSDALIDVPDEIESIQTGSLPVLDTLNVSTNGTYTPPAGTDGYDEVNVNVPGATLQSKTITENGTYTPGVGVDGYNEVIVNVQHVASNITIKVAREYVGSDSTYTGAELKKNMPVYVDTGSGVVSTNRNSTDGIYDIFTVPEGAVVYPATSQFGSEKEYSTDDGATWSTTYQQFKPQGDAKAQYQIATTNNQIMTFQMVKENE